MCVVNNLHCRLYWSHGAQPQMNLIVIVDGELSGAALNVTNVKTIESAAIMDLKLSLLFVLTSLTNIIHSHLVAAN